MSGISVNSRLYFQLYVGVLHRRAPDFIKANPDRRVSDLQVLIFLPLFYPSENLVLDDDLDMRSVGYFDKAISHFRSSLK